MAYLDPPSQFVYDFRNYTNIVAGAHNVILFTYHLYYTLRPRFKLDAAPLKLVRRLSIVTLFLTMVSNIFISIASNLEEMDCRLKIVGGSLCWFYGLSLSQ